MTHDSHPIHLPQLTTSGPAAKIEELRHAPAHEATFTPHALRGPEDFVGRPADLLALESAIVEAMRMVFDPELPINIYDLGLIYDIVISAERAVQVKMTLTAPGCPVAGTLPGMVERRVREVPGVASAKVELVWSPAWGKEMMSEAARLELGLL